MVTTLLLGLLLSKAPAIDATTLKGKVMCGYQGWFRCPGDETNRGWFHWSRDGQRIDPTTLTFEMWPDMSEYPKEAQYPAGDFTYPNGKAATLYSATHPGVVRKHFDWMQKYGIDGVFVQRFLGGLDGGAGSREEARVLNQARIAANLTGRTFAVEYDMSGKSPDEAISRMVRDWHFLVDELHITDDPRYLRHNGKPVLEIFGFYADRFNGKDANRIIDAFSTNDKYAVSLVGAGQWWWRRETDPDWSRAFRRFVAFSPWNVGNTKHLDDGRTIAATASWADDLAEATRAKMMLLPVFYPGFSWDNLQRKAPGSTLVSRRKGEFFREQFRAAADLGISQAFVAMFDEVDEGTAIYKVTNQPPTQGHFVTLDGVPTDTYLKIAGEGTQAIRRNAAK